VVGTKPRSLSIVDTFIGVEDGALVMLGHAIDRALMASMVEFDAVTRRRGISVDVLV
jgi:hypothetical protein